MMTWTLDPSFTISVTAPSRMRVLGRWQRIIHWVGGWLQDFAYDHSPEVEVEAPPNQYTYTSTAKV